MSSLESASLVFDLIEALEQEGFVRSEIQGALTLYAPESANIIRYCFEALSDIEAALTFEWPSGLAA